MQLLINNIAYHLRVMEAHDIDAVLRIEQQSQTHPWSSSHFLSSIESSHHCHVLLKQDSIVGFIITSTAADEAELLNIAVAPKELGKGLGSALIEFACDYFNDTINTFFLEVRESNIPALALYHKLGFNEVGRRRDYYPAQNQQREDAILMAKTLRWDAGF